MKTTSTEATPSTKDLLIEIASLKTALMRCETVIAEMAATIKELKSGHAQMKRDVLDAGYEAIQANDRSQAIEQKLQQISERNNHTLADRIRTYIRQTGEKSIRSSMVRKLFGIAHHSQSNVAMKRVATLCPDIKLTQFRSRHGAELALVVV